MPSLFGWLDNFSWWANLDYPTKGAILRGLKAGLSVLVGIALAGVSQGIIMLPPDWSPAIVFVVTMLLQSVDKFLRETQIANQVAKTDAALGPEIHVVPVVPATTVNTDATVVTAKKK